MLSLTNQYIGDPWFYPDPDGTTMHCYFLTTPKTCPPQEKWSHWDIGHAVSADLVAWRYQGLILQRGGPGEWDEQKLATGSVIRHAGRYYLAYTGHRVGEKRHLQRTGLAVSDDLYRWQKLPGNPATEPDGVHYELRSSGSRDLGGQWRDPFIFPHTGWFYQLICARANQGEPSTRGVVGLARSRDLTTWEILPPLELPPFAEELECPTLHCLAGRYYLLFSTLPQLVAPAIKAEFADQTWTGATYSFVAAGPFGPFRRHGTGQVQPAGSPNPVYAGQLVAWRERLYLMGFSLERDDTIADPVPVEARPEGIKAVAAG